ncbi:MAG: histidine kinase dimerization/phospho-acceptor domain-containing protein [Caldilineaceae bacterium]
MTDSIQPHEPPIKLSTATDTQVAIRTAFSGWVGESLPSLAFGFIWLYLLFGFAHLFTLPAPARWIMSTTALGTMAVMGGLRWFWERNPAKGEWAHAGAALLAGLVGVNSVMHLFLTGDVLQSTNLMLLVVGIGFFFLSSIWFIGALLVVYGCWWLAILTINVESGIWIHFTFGLLSASLLSTLAHIARKRTLRRVTLLRLSDEQRAKQLQDALFAEQAVEEALRQSEMRYRLLYAEVEQRAQELDIANTQLAQAARLKNEFLASVSHELRTPLTAILGLTQSLQEDVYGPLNGLQQNVLRNIDQSGHHLLALITDILDVAKIEAGRFSLDLGPAAVDAVCQSSLLLMKQKAEQKQLTVTVDFDAAVKIIEADERRLKQILVNLLDNAVKFTPQKGAIGLTVSGDTAESGCPSFCLGYRNRDCAPRFCAAF